MSEIYLQRLMHLILGFKLETVTKDASEIFLGNQKLLFSNYGPHTQYKPKTLPL